jgi:protein-disulfide isomerase
VRDSDLRSAPVPPVAVDDHVSGAHLPGPLIIEYVDFECPFCAVLHEVLSGASVHVVFRHFPVRSSHPRAWPSARAAEAASLQGRFWEMHDRLFADQSRLEDPHLWDHAGALGLDLGRFDADRRGQAVEERVRRDFKGGVRAGVVTTPTVFVDGRRFDGRGAITGVERLLGV